MGSDHRAVYAELILKRRPKKRYSKPKLERGCRPDTVFTKYVQDRLIAGIFTVSSLTALITEALQESRKNESKDRMEQRKPSQSDEIQELLALRRLSNGSERKGLSKRI